MNHLVSLQLFSGTAVNDANFQAILLEGFYRRNQDRASRIVAAEAPLYHSYSGLLRHTVNELAQTVLENPLDPSFHQPRAYNGELIGIDYLYSRTGRALQVIEEEKDEKEDEAAGSSQEEEEFDIERHLTIPEADFPSIPVRPTERPEANAKRPPSSTARPLPSRRAVQQRGAVRSPASAEESPKRPTPEFATESKPSLL